MNASQDPDPAASPDARPATDAKAAEPSPAAPTSAPTAAASAPESELAAAKASVAALEDRLRRQQAEFVNETRRIQRQADERVKFAVQPVLSDLLGVVDALHGAIEGLKDTEHERRVAEGLKLVEKELLEALARHGVARIDAIGKPFDPTFHEAILEMEGAGAPGSVLQVTRPGFLLHGRLLRAAHVIVSKAKPGAASSAKPAKE